MENIISITALVISSLSLLIASLTAWLTLLKTGSVKMTKPTQIYFGPDGGGGNHFKIYFLTLLYATSKKGCVIENMFVRLRYLETQQDFNIWVYDDRSASKLVRGSGLKVTDSGMASAHHYLLPKNADNMILRSGDYTLEVHAQLVGKAEAIKLAEVTLPINESEAQQLKDKKCGIYFDWGAFSQQYLSHIDDRMSSRKADMEYFLQEILNSK